MNIENKNIMDKNIMDENYIIPIKKSTSINKKFRTLADKTGVLFKNATINEIKNGNIPIVDTFIRTVNRKVFTPDMPVFPNELGYTPLKKSERSKPTTVYLDYKGERGGKNTYTYQRKRKNNNKTRKYKKYTRKNKKL